MELTFFQGLWFMLIFVLIAGYFVLDGFDLGSGVLYPFVAKGDTEKAVVRRSIGPVWDGNEVWLLTAGGALFAAFPAAYATTFSGFYLAIMLVLFGLIVRAVSLEYRGHDPKWGRLWDGCFFVGSLVPALLFGVAVGNVFAGIPMDANGDYSGFPLLGLISPFTLLCGLLGLSMFLAQGSEAFRFAGACSQAAASFADCGCCVVRAGVGVRAGRHPACHGPGARRAALGVRGARACRHRRLAFLLTEEAVRSRCVHRTVGFCVYAGRAVGYVDVSEFRGGLGRERRSVSHGDERVVVRTHTHVDDHHHVRRPAARAPVPRDYLPHVPWSGQR